MNQILVKIIEDSIVPYYSPRLTTFQLQYPRFIHSEIGTHRVFSRNSASSRAIPSRKIREQIRTLPAMPVEWGRNEPGMQANFQLPTQERNQVETLWKELAWAACDYALKMEALGAHKQIVNRVLEPFMLMHTIITATDWENFFKLRCHKDADPTIRALALTMQEEYKKSVPKVLSLNDWHLPYITDEEKSLHPNEVCAKISMARCARVSYLNHDGTNCNTYKDLQLAEKLIASNHMSPSEHQAQPGLIGNKNFEVGWSQHRYLIEKGLKA